LRYFDEEKVRQLFSLLAERIKSFKGSWNRITQNLKDKMLAAKEKSRAMRDFGTSIGITCKWALDDGTK